MLIFDLDYRCVWIHYVKERMVGEQDVTDVEDIERLGQGFVRDLVAGRKIRGTEEGSEMKEKGREGGGGHIEATCDKRY